MHIHHRPGERGFSLIEMLIVIAIVGVVAAMAIPAIPTVLRSARADAGSAQALELLQSARELAVDQRRNVEVRLIGTDTLQTARVEYPSGLKTVLRTTQLENRVQFLLQAGVPDTPDLFGNATAVAFGTSATRMFTSEGTFVDANGDVLNGSLFMSVPGDITSARAITIFGTTGLLRAWRWDGQKWVG